MTIRSRLRRVGCPTQGSEDLVGRLEAVRLDPAARVGRLAGRRMDRPALEPLMDRWALG